MQPENSALNIKIPKVNHRAYPHKFHLFHKLSVFFAKGTFPCQIFFIVSSLTLYFIRTYFKIQILQLKQQLTL